MYKQSKLIIQYWQHWLSILFGPQVTVEKTVQQPGEINNNTDTFRKTSFPLLNSYQLWSIISSLWLPLSVKILACYRPSSARSTIPPSSSNNNNNNNMDTLNPNDPTIHQFGYKLTRFGKHDKSAFAVTELAGFFDMIAALDPNAMIIPASKDMSKKQSIKTNLNDCIKFTDAKAIPWGKPGSNQYNGCFSFWIETDKEELSAGNLRRNQIIATWLEKHRAILNNHQLHETQSKSVGFFQAKDPKHAWRKDLKNRIQEAWKQHNTGQPMPPMEVKPAVVRFKGITSHTVSVFVGATDVSRVSAFFQQHPFNQPCFIPQEARRGNPDDFEKHLKLHNHMQDNSGALKIENATDKFVSHLRAHAITHLQTQVIDVSHKQTERSVVYVQCLKPARESLSETIQQFISEWSLQNTDETAPTLVHQPGFDQQSFATNSTLTQPTVAATVTPWDFLLKESDFNHNSTAPTFTPNIPAIVNTNSYAAAAMGLSRTKDNGSDGNSEATASIANTSIKTLEDANRQLEDNNKKLQTQLREQQNDFAVKMAQLSEVISNLTDQVQAQSQALQAQKQEFESLKATLSPKNSSSATKTQREHEMGTPNEKAMSS